jgi:hypothetical protein
MTLEQYFIMTAIIVVLGVSYLFYCAEYYEKKAERLEKELNHLKVKYGYLSQSDLPEKI